MKTSSILIISTVLTALSTTFFVVADEPSSKVNITTLKHIMQGLLRDTQALTQGIFFEDFQLIEQAAKRIADHPTADLSIKMKLIGNLGADMSRFKKLDKQVHDIALDIRKAAIQQDMSTTIIGYHKLIDGCQSCHSNFKQPVSKLLSQD